MGWTWLGVLLACVLLFWTIGAYNRVTQLRNGIDAAYGKLDLQLATRAKLVQRLIDLLHPELVTEQASFDALHAAQQAVDAAAAQVRARPGAPHAVKQLTLAGAVHAAALARLLALLDQHAELHSRADLQPLLEALKTTEGQYSFARQVFNEAVRIYNEALNQFPTRVLVSLFGFKQAHPL